VAVGEPRAKFAEYGTLVYYSKEARPLQVRFLCQGMSIWDVADLDGEVDAQTGSSLECVYGDGTSGGVAGYVRLADPIYRSQYGCGNTGS
jgi:hypothetical protein